MDLERRSSGTYDEFRGMLESRRAQLTDELERLMTRIREQGSKAILESEPVEVEMCNLDMSLVDLTNTMLKRVDAALDRLEGGSYGRCTRCGDAIGEARLRAMPFAARCQPCEAARESRISCMNRRENASGANVSAGLGNWPVA